MGNKDKNNFKIAVLSGKGGTGKTMVSVNLASSRKNAVYIDCDVEEPNGYLFFKPTNIKTKDVCVKIPKINSDICISCRKCVDFCKFNALAMAKEKILILEEVCHSCGGCKIVCPVDAIEEEDKKIGEIQSGKSNGMSIKTGILNIGEVTGVKIIDELLKMEESMDTDIVIDCPPGSACSVMESIKDADYCVLVTEPTSFGVHNLNMVYELVKLFNKPYGVIINKYIEDENLAQDFCKKNNINVLGKIPYSKEISKINSRGDIILHHKDEKYKNLFNDIYSQIEEEIKK